MTETALNKFVNSRYGLFAFAIVALIVSYANSFGSEAVADAGGLLPYSIGSISLSPFASWLANCLCICLSGVLLFKTLQGRGQGQEETRGCFRRWERGRM